MSQETPYDAMIKDELEQQANAEALASDNADDAPLQESAQVPSEEVARLEEQVQVLKDQLLREQAETQNIRRRADQDIQKAHKFALERFVGELLPVADNLERALVAAKEKGVEADLEGVELTLKELLKVFEKFSVVAINPEGEPFDPELHQAMSMVPNDDVEPNTVLTVFQKGYTLSGRLVRPAMVVVSNSSAS